MQSHFHDEERRSKVFIPAIGLILSWESQLSDIRWKIDCSRGKLVFLGISDATTGARLLMENFVVGVIKVVINVEFEAKR